MKESALKRAVMAYLALHADCVIVRVFCGSVKAERGGWITGATPGTADLLGVCAGVPVAFELKATKGRVRPEQREFAERWQSAGGVYRLVRTLDDVADGLLECRNMQRTDDRTRGVRGGEQ